jgi:hypothetical protein
VRRIREGILRRRVLEKGRPETGTATARGKRREKSVYRRFPPAAPSSEPAFIGKTFRLTVKLAFYPDSECPRKGAAGEVRPVDQPEATNSVFSSVFGDGGGGIGRFFLKILLKSGSYERGAGQDVQRKRLTGTPTWNGDSL